MLTISYSETRTQGTLSTWQRCTLEAKALGSEQFAELERLVSSSGVSQVRELILPTDAILQGVHWTLVTEDDAGLHKIIGKSARNPNLPLQDCDPEADPDQTPENPLNYERLGELLEFLKPHLKSGFASDN